ncbi:MAG: hypothetical protein FVQ78_03345 [Solirubrobacterales bacterium]|nr:hypothetical protein [Solirubrobacterales bacterium]
MRHEADRDSTLTLYRRGIELLEERDFEEAAAPLAAAARREDRRLKFYGLRDNLLLSCVGR